MVQGPMASAGATSPIGVDQPYGFRKELTGELNYRVIRWLDKDLTGFCLCVCVTNSLGSAVSSVTKASRPRVPAAGSVTKASRPRVPAAGSVTKASRPRVPVAGSFTRKRHAPGSPQGIVGCVWTPTCGAGGLVEG
eukprot:1182583-Prorocentrum_minimum.AAC.2